MLRYLVQKTEAVYLTARDGEEAISLFADNIVDMVLLVIRLPKKNRYEVLQYIRRLNSTIPVITETANAMREEILNFSILGFSEYLVKPIDKKALHHVLQKYMYAEKP